MQKNISENMIAKNFILKKYWRNIDKQILFGFTLLFILGVFFSFSSTSILADERLDREYYSFFQKHLLYTTLSFCLMIFISSINNNLIINTILPGFLTFFILLAIVPLVGIEVKGAKRWLDFYFFRLHPYFIL